MPSKCCCGALKRMNSSKYHIIPLSTSSGKSFAPDISTQRTHFHAPRKICREVREIRSSPARRGNVRLYRAITSLSGKEGGRRGEHERAKMRRDTGDEQWETSRPGAQVNFPPDRDFACATDGHGADRVIACVRLVSRHVIPSKWRNACGG